jgi:arginyl-tRNA synthetase
VAFDKAYKEEIAQLSTGKTEEEAKKQATNYSRSTRNAPKWEAGDEAVKSL